MVTIIQDKPGWTREEYDYGYMGTVPLNGVSFEMY